MIASRVTARPRPSLHLPELFPVLLACLLGKALMMHATSISRGFVHSLLLLVAIATAAPARAADRRQFGGPRRDVKSDATGRATPWPESGPKQLWSRDLGDGYSTILVEGDTLYTMYRKDNDEFAVALSAADGKTIWEHKHEAPFTEEQAQFGPGPHATPLIVGDRIYTVGTRAVLHCLDKKTGQPLWSHDLVKEFSGNDMGRGYSSSPMAYKNTLIVQVGGAGNSVMAFDLESGSVVWKRNDWENSHASPLLINVDGQDQLVVFSVEQIVGMNPDNGEVLWTHEHKTQWGANISTPVCGPDNVIFFSAAYGMGSRAIKLAQKDGKTTVEELWYRRRLKVHHGNVVRVGDFVYLSSGDFGPAFLMAVDIKDGVPAWQERQFSKATLVYADGKLVVLDEDGNLALVEASPKGFKLHGKVQLLEKTAWTTPTLAGKTLYIRDRKKIMALDLG